MNNENPVMQYIVVSKANTRNNNSVVYTVLSDNTMKPYTGTSPQLNIMAGSTREKILKLLGKTKTEKARVWIGRPVNPEASWKHHYLYVLDPRLIKPKSNSTSRLLSQLKLVNGVQRESRFYEFNISNAKSSYVCLNEEKALYLIRDTLVNTTIYHGHRGFHKYAMNRLRNAFVVRNRGVNAAPSPPSVSPGPTPPKRSINSVRGKNNSYYQLMMKRTKSVGLQEPPNDRIYVTYFTERKHPLSIFYPSNKNIASIRSMFRKAPTDVFIPYHLDAYGHLIALKKNSSYMLLPVNGQFKYANKNIEPVEPVFVHTIPYPVP